MAADDPGWPLSAPHPMRRSGDTDTMAAWEHFLSGDPRASVPSRHFVVASWLRSKEAGIDPTGRSAPIAAVGEAFAELRRRHVDLMSAAAPVFALLGDMFSGSRSIMILTNPDGVVLDAVGDRKTLEQGERIHLTPGGTGGRRRSAPTASAPRWPPAAPPRCTRPSISARASRPGPALPPRCSSR